ncbi:MAG: GGDEF domain-containing protein [Ilumatobacteraceae bacterium]
MRILVALVRAMGAPRDVQAPLTWLVMACVVLIAQLVGYLIVATVLHWHGIPVRMSSILGAGLHLKRDHRTRADHRHPPRRRPLATVLLTSVGCFPSVASLPLVRAAGGSPRQPHPPLRLHPPRRGSNDPDAVPRRCSPTHVSSCSPSEPRSGCSLTGPDDRPSCRCRRSAHRGVPANAHELVAAWFDGTDDVAHVRERLRVLARPSDRRLRGPGASLRRSPSPGPSWASWPPGRRSRRRVTEFRSRDVRLFATLAGHAGAALENGRMMDRLRDEARAREHDALHDALTGLPNRVLFARRVRAGFDAAQQTGPNDGPVIGLLDLDGFKLVNDTLGHHWGDEVLVEVARRLVRVVDPSVTVARLGGDEFALFVPSITPSDLTRLAALLRSTIGANFPTAVGEVRVGVSIGFARTHPAERQLDTAVLMRRADAAMYRAKQANHRGDAAGYEIDEGADIDDIDDVDGQVVR